MKIFRATKHQDKWKWPYVVYLFHCTWKSSWLVQKDFSILRLGICNNEDRKLHSWNQTILGVSRTLFYYKNKMKNLLTTKELAKSTPCPTWGVRLSPKIKWSRENRYFSMQIGKWRSLMVVCRAFFAKPQTSTVIKERWNIPVSRSQSFGDRNYFKLTSCINLHPRTSLYL